MDPGTLDALPLAVDQPDLAESGVAGRLEVGLDDGRDLVGPEGMEVEGVLDRDDHRLVAPRHGGERTRSLLARRRGFHHACALVRGDSKGGAPMAATLDAYRDLFEKKAFAHLATVGPDGAPQVTPVWVDYDGTSIRFNTAKGRVKVRNLARNPRVALAIQDPDNPYRYVQIRGRVVEATEQGADAHIDALAKKYLGQDRYPFRQPGEVRILYKVRPERVQGM